MRTIAGIALAAGLALSVAPAIAATTYRVNLNGNDLSQATPLSRSTSVPLGASNGTAIFTGAGFAYPGRLGIYDRVDMHWTSGFSGGALAEVYSSLRVEDLIISGPAAPSVAGVLHFRVQASFGRLGGFAGNGSHGSSLFVRASVNGILTTGNYAVNNAGTTTSNGCLSGLSGDVIDKTFDLGGNFPVGVPIFVELMLETVSSCYGNVGNANPGFVEGSAGSGGGPFPSGLWLAESGGALMTLPAGYTLSSASWNVVDNHLAPTVLGAPPADATELALVAEPNPSAGALALRLSLPAAGHVRIQIFDASGRSVRDLGQWLPAGTSRVAWDGDDSRGAHAGAGLYFARVEVGGRSVTRRIVRVE